MGRCMLQRIEPHVARHRAVTLTVRRHQRKKNFAFSVWYLAHRLEAFRDLKLQWMRLI